MQIVNPMPGELIALDSCVVIGIIKSSKTALKITKIIRGKNYGIVLQDVVLQESQKILHLSKDDIIEKIGFVLRKEIHVFSTSNDMRRNAKRIESQYGICHFPDSLILSAAKLNSWVLLSLDNNLLQTADFEGILGFNPLKGGLL